MHRLVLVSLVVVAGCSGGASTPSALEPPTPEAHATPPRTEPPAAVAQLVPAFVVFTHDRDRELTTVVPLDPAREVQRETGYWILDPDRGVAVRSALPRGLPTCPCPDTPNGCDGEELERRAYPGTDAPCACVYPALPAGEDDTVSADHRDFSILGTTLIRLGELHEESELANLYYADVESLSLTLAAGEGTVPVVDPPGDASFRYCIEGQDGPDLAFRIPEVACMRADGRWFPARTDTGQPVEAESPSECASCRGSQQATATILRGGRLATFQWGYFGPTLIVWTSPSAQCPSAWDTCGGREGFPTMAYDIDRPYEGRFWIASSGEAALVGEHGAVLLRGASAPVRDAGDLALGDALGVHFHADVSPLLAGMRAYSARALVPAPRCASDADCRGAGSCGLRCHGGACEPIGPDACDAAHVCGEGLACVEGACAPIDVDRDLLDTHGGRDFGARCTEHLRAGALDAAVRACERGLAIATEDRVRGALLFNLGRCAELRGSTSEARAFYERSLAVRPDSAPTRARLDALAE